MIDPPGWNSSQTIDWAKAPEWAGAVVEARCGTKFWVTKFGGVSARQRVGASKPDTEVAKMRGSHDWTLVETRPTESPAWNGEGLPPVGTVCEYYWGDRKWVKCTVFAHKPNANGGMDALVDLAGGDWTFGRHPTQFRPIRTPEQIAAEEREKAIQQMIEDADYDGKMVRGLFAKLHDAGYRKVEQP